MHFKDPIYAPSLKELVRGLARKIPKNPKVFQALKTYGEFTDEQALKALEWGSSPEIRVGALGPKTWGRTPDNADHFVLNEIIVRQFEVLTWAALNVADPYIQDRERVQRRREWTHLLARGNLTIEALILHETVHWGDGQTYKGSSLDKYQHQDDAAKRAGFLDRGHQFAHAAYGSRLGFKKTSRGLLLTDHEIDGWMGTVKLDERNYGFYRPLGHRGPGTIRPPALSR